MARSAPSRRSSTSSGPGAAAEIRNGASISAAVIGALDPPKLGPSECGDEGHDMRTSSEVRSAVLGAFFHEQDAGRPAVVCYTAGVSAWRARFPDQPGRYAAKHAVTLMLDATMRFAGPRTTAEKVRSQGPSRDGAAGREWREGATRAIENRHRAEV